MRDTGVTYGKTRFFGAAGGQIQTRSGYYGGNGDHSAKPPSAPMKACKEAGGRWETCLECRLVRCVYDAPEQTWKMRKAK